ncbi:MAG: hypothetical protein K2L53_00080, partial [Clostridia bacterium]|nr:hypothetical protein [Clostridia bacterium]
MKKKQKENLIKAFEELNAPDKDVLLQKIESKKALGGEFAQEEARIKKARRRNRVAWTSLACFVVVIAIVAILISNSIFRTPDDLPDGDGSNIGGSDIDTDVIDYRNSWKFSFDGNISFDDIDETLKDLGMPLIYEYQDGWSVVETEITQDESAFREYYVKDGVTVEVTILLQEKVT